MPRQLRYLQTLNSISAENNSTIVFPVPIDIMSQLMNTTKGTSVSKQSTSSNLMGHVLKSGSGNKASRQTTTINMMDTENEIIGTKQTTSINMVEETKVDNDREMISFLTILISEGGYSCGDSLTQLSVLSYSLLLVCSVGSIKGFALHKIS